MDLIIKSKIVRSDERVCICMYNDNKAYSYCKVFIVVIYKICTA